MPGHQNWLLKRSHRALVSDAKRSKVWGPQRLSSMAKKDWRSCQSSLSVSLDSSSARWFISRGTQCTASWLPVWRHQPKMALTASFSQGTRLPPYQQYSSAWLSTYALRRRPRRWGREHRVRSSAQASRRVEDCSCSAGLKEPHASWAVPPAEVCPPQPRAPASE